MRVTQLLLLFVFASIALLPSCTKEGTTTTASATLSSHPWVIKSELIDPPYDYYGNGSEYVSNLFSKLPSEERDNVYNFNEDGSFVLDEGATKKQGDPQIVQRGTWELNESTRNLTIWIEYPFVEKSVVPILSLSSSNLRYRLTLNASTGINYSIEVAFKAK